MEQVYTAFAVTTLSKWPSKLNQLLAEAGLQNQGPEISRSSFDLFRKQRLKPHPSLSLLLLNLFRNSTILLSPSTQDIHRQGDGHQWFHSCSYYVSSSVPAPVSPATILVSLLLPILLLNILLLNILLLNILLLALLQRLGLPHIASESPALVPFQHSFRPKSVAARAACRSEPTIRVSVRGEALHRRPRFLNGIMGSERFKCKFDGSFLFVTRFGVRTGVKG